MRVMKTDDELHCTQHWHLGYLVDGAKDDPGGSKRFSGKLSHFCGEASVACLVAGMKACDKAGLDGSSQRAGDETSVSILVLLLGDPETMVTPLATAEVMAVKAACRPPIIVKKELCLEGSEVAWASGELTASLLDMSASGVAVALRVS